MWTIKNFLALLVIDNWAWVIQKTQQHGLEHYWVVLGGERITKWVVRFEEKLG